MSYIKFNDLPYKKDPIDEDFTRCTKAQWNYIELLSNDLELSSASRNAHITAVIGHMKWKNDYYLLSKQEASQVIAKFIEWKKQKKGY